MHWFQRETPVGVRRLISLCAFILLVTACQPIQDPRQAVQPTPAPTAAVDPLVAQFRAAVVDASTADPDEISDQLTVIAPSNETLLWNEAGTHVLMATWTSWGGYDAQVGKEMVLQREAWVTAVPAFQNFCQRYTAEERPLVLRLEQLLGLPPNNGKTKVVELWIPAAGLFRPSPDPEIDDQVAELEFPEPSTFDSQAEYEFHRDWYNLQVSLSYDPVNGYPWTRLGYTYDWGNPESEVGLSEFVTYAQTPVIIEQVSTTEEYCQP